MKSVLFVDDDINLLQSLQRILHKMKGTWAMDFVSSSSEALALLKTKKYNCVVVDYKMPGINGLELLKFVAELLPEARKILLSGQVDEDVYAEAKSITDKYLPKPCQPQELVKALEELLQ